MGLTKLLKIKWVHDGSNLFDPSHRKSNKTEELGLAIAGHQPELKNTRNFLGVIFGHCPIIESPHRLLQSLVLRYLRLRQERIPWSGCTQKNLLCLVCVSYYNGVAHHAIIGKDTLQERAMRYMPSWGLVCFTTKNCIHLIPMEPLLKNWKYVKKHFQELMSVWIWPCNVFSSLNPVVDGCSRTSVGDYLSRYNNAGIRCRFAIEQLLVRGSRSQLFLGRRWVLLCFLCPDVLSAVRGSKPFFKSSALIWALQKVAN